MDCSTAEGGILPLVNGVELSVEEAAMDAGDLFFLFPPVTWFVRVCLFIFLHGIFGELNCKFHVGFCVQECVHAQALNRYIALASVSTLTWFKGV